MLVQSDPVKSKPNDEIEFPSTREAFFIWLKIGLLSFGGPAGQIAMMHRVLVEEKRWISEERFLHALNYVMLLPGPEAQQLATYAGWLLHRTRGGIIAGGLFILPGALVMLTLTILYAGFRDFSFVEAFFFGIKAAVLAIVIQAVVRIGSRALPNKFMVLIALLAFVGIFFFTIPFPLIICGAALTGFVYSFLAPHSIAIAQSESTAPRSGPKYAVDVRIDAGALTHIQPSLPRSVRIVFWGVTLWLAPVLIIMALLGPEHIYSQESFFFSKMAVVTFGGAYSVLAYVAQQAVEFYGWLGPGEMLHGLGLAETTPGPLIMVVQYVGFLAAFRNPGEIDPFIAGTIGAFLTTWVTFIPCFLWIFLGAPYIERLRNNRFVTAALTAITAAVVGVVLYVAVWFGLHVCFENIHEFRFDYIRLLVPDWPTFEPGVLLITLAALIAALKYKADMFMVIGASAVLGILYFYMII